MPISINNTTLTFNNGTTMTTAATGTVSSVATGNGLQGGTITTSGTLSVAAPGANTVGSYAAVYVGSNNNANRTLTFGGNYGVGFGDGQFTGGILWNDSTSGVVNISRNNQELSGTWRWMGPSYTYATNFGLSSVNYGIACRVS